MELGLIDKHCLETNGLVTGRGEHLWEVVGFKNVLEVGTHSYDLHVIRFQVRESTAPSLVNLENRISEVCPQKTDINHDH